MIASFIFVILVCGILFDHVPDRTVISQGFSNTISSGARIDGSGIKYAIRGERFSEQMPIVCLLRSTARNTGYLSRTPLVLAGFGSLIFLAVLTALLLHLYAKGHDTGSRLRILRWLFRTDGKNAPSILDNWIKMVCSFAVNLLFFMSCLWFLQKDGFVMSKIKYGGKWLCWEQFFECSYFYRRRMWCT